MSVSLSTNRNKQPFWIGDTDHLNAEADALPAAIAMVRKPIYVVDHSGQTAVAHRGAMTWERAAGPAGQHLPLIAYVPPLHPAELGDAGFKRDLGIKYAYVVGAMANGITSVEMVAAAGKAGMVGFFGAGGLSLEQIEQAIDRLDAYAGVFPYGFNLIHNPSDMNLEMATAELYIRKKISLISASAYLGLTLPLVYYRIKGIHRTEDGRIICPNRIIAKVSRFEVAAKFFAPPPHGLLDQLVFQGKISDQEARLARQVPMAQDITAEADSGGHTDNRPALTLLPTLMAMRDQAVKKHGFKTPLRVGLAGGIATPDAVAGAFAMGAAYILTGSINQAAVEADTSDLVREMLVQAEQADVTMAPAADMFKMGVKVQVLKRGTMFAMRAGKLYELYRTYDAYDQIPPRVRAMLERNILRQSFASAWEETRQFFMERDPSQIDRAEKDPSHKMALVFRSYLGRASLWAKSGLTDRKIDYQIWCGPAMGAFNAWVQGSFMEPASERTTGAIALNLLYGAVFFTRCMGLKNQGVQLPAELLTYKPLQIKQIESYLST